MEINNKIVSVLTCECKPGFNWKNKNTYNAHKKSLRHKLYEINKEEREYKININKIQIEYNKLKLENMQLRELYLNLAKENMNLKKKLNLIN